MFYKVLFFVTVFLFSLLSSALQRSFSAQMQAGLEERSFQFWFFLIILVVLQFLGKPVTVSLWLRAFSNLKVTWEDLHRALKEYIRSLGSILTWGLFFVLPGVWRLFQLYWVVWIVILSRRYQRGKLDALQASQLIFKKKPLFSVIMVIVFEILIATAIESFGDWKNLSNLSDLVSAIQQGFAHSIVQWIFLNYVFKRVRGLIDALDEEQGPQDSPKQS